MYYRVKYVEYEDFPDGRTVTNKIYHSNDKLIASLNEHGYDGESYVRDMNENGISGYKPNSYDSVEVLVKGKEDEDD